MYRSCIPLLLKFAFEGWVAHAAQLMLDTKKHLFLNGAQGADPVGNLKNRAQAKN